MYYSPLRYPGGKRRLANFMKLLMRTNDLLDGEYAEAYAGGAAIALELLFGEYVKRIHINDLDDALYAFWWSVLNETETLCQRIRDVPVTVDEWEKQREVLQSHEPGIIDLGLATFFLNRTNRSGIITGGVIGGKSQSGKWKINARFNKEDLINRIEKIGRFSDRVELYNIEGTNFIKKADLFLPNKSLIYIDPPYYVAGKQNLYANFYEHEDHLRVASEVKNLSKSWVVSYDNVKEIRNIYSKESNITYGISYTAQEKYEGDEIMILASELTIPSVRNPSRINKKDFRQLELSLFSSH